MVPVQIRVGGAFLGVALALTMYAVIALLRGEAIFAITPQVLTVLAAVVLVGAFATYDKTQPGSRTQVGALAAAVALIGLGVVLPGTALAVTTPFWLLGWALTAGLCAAVLRRSVAR